MPGDRQFFKAGGTLDPQSECYIERAADRDLLAALLAGELVYVLDSRQKGKSSLIVRTIQRLKDQGVQTVKLDLQRVGANVTAEQWYAGLLHGIGTDLDLSNQLFGYWSSNQALGPLARWLGAIESVVLPTITDQLVIFVDEIDFVKALPFSTDDFFAGIRDCYNRRADEPLFRKLTFCLVGVATPGQLISNPQVTPFNIGTRLDLSDFSYEELSPFADHLDEVGRDGGALLWRVHGWVNGHPYLTQLLCSKISEDAGIESPRQVDALVKRLLLSVDARNREPNLADLERRILDPEVPGLSHDESRSQILEIYRKLLESETVQSVSGDPLTDALRLAGIAVDYKGTLKLRNRLYARIFDERWRRQSLPGLEQRRQSAAARRAALKTSLVFAAVLSVLALVGLRMLSLAKERDKALVEARNVASVAQHQAYSSTMFVVSEEARNGRWLRAADLLDSVRDSPWLGWEWRYWSSQFARSKVISPADRATLVLNKSRSRIAEAGWFEGNSMVSASQLSVNDPAKVTWLMRTAGVAPLSERFTFINTRFKANTKMVVSVPEAMEPYIEFANGTLTYRDYKLGLHKHLDYGVRVTQSTTSATGAISKDHRTGIVGFSGVGIFAFDLSSGNLKWHVPSQSLNQCVFFPSGKIAALATNDPNLRIIDVQSGRTLREFKGHLAVLTSVVFLPRRNQVATGSMDGTVRIWDFETGGQLSVLVGHRERIVSLAVSSDENSLLSSSIDGEIRQWDLDALSRTGIWKPHKDEIHKLNLSSTGGVALTASMDGTAAVFDWKTGKTLGRFPINTPPTPMTEASASREPWGAVACKDGSIQVVDLETGKSNRTIRMPEGRFTGVAISCNDQFVAGTLGSTKLVLFETATWLPIKTLSAHSTITSVAFAPDGSTVAIGDSEGEVLIASLRSSAINKPFRADFKVVGLEYSHDGRYLAGASHDSLIYVHELAMNKTRKFDGHTGRAWEAHFSPDDKVLLSVSFDGTARLWSVDSGKEIAVLRHDSWVSHGLFSPSGNRVVTVSADNSIRMWDTASGAELTRLTGHSQVVFSAAFTPDESRLITVSNDRTLRIWEAPDGATSQSPLKRP